MTELDEKQRLAQAVKSARLVKPPMTVVDKALLLGAHTGVTLCIALEFAYSHRWWAAAFFGTAAGMLAGASWIFRVHHRMRA